jgi:uncharacterized protein YkwD
MMKEEVYRGLRTATFLAAAVAMAMGCAGLANANKRSPGSTRDGKFKPAATYPPAANYGPEPKYTCPSGGVNGAVEDELKRQDLKGKKIVADGRLCALADTMLGYQLAENEALPESVRVFISAYFGLPVTLSSRAFLSQDVEVDLKKFEAIADSMVTPLVAFAETAKAPHYGLIADSISSSGVKGRDAMVSDNPAGKTRVRMIMYDEAVVIDPLPRALPAGGTAKLSGHVEGTIKNLKVQVVDPVGKLTTTKGEGNAFSAPIACGEHNGKMLVQITGESDSGDTQLASLPIVCGGSLATEVALPSAGPAGAFDAAAGEKSVSDAINADRTGAGLKPLNVNAALSGIARSLAEQQAAGKTVSGADLTTMLQDKEISPSQTSETGARAASADEALAQLSNNPSDRANEMSPDVTDIGIGVAKGPDLGGKPSAIVIMLYLKQLPPADPVAAKSKLYESIAKKRADSKLETLTKDEVLESVAQKYAEAAAKHAGQVPKEDETEIMAPLYKNAMVVNQMGGWVPDEAAAAGPSDQGTALGKGKAIGAGVALGRSVQYGKNSLFVVVLIGTKQAAAKPARRAPAKKK